MFTRFQKLQNLKDCNNVALGKRGWCVQKQACFCFKGGEEFIFIWVLFFLQHSVKEESISLFNRIAQENKEEHAFPVTKLPEDACLTSKTQQTDTFCSMQTLFYEDPHGASLPLPLSKMRSVPCILLSL